jgi:hypothetical protein
MRALLEVNVPMAPLDCGHLHHRLAARWLQDNIGRLEWARVLGPRLA